MPTAGTTTFQANEVADPTEICGTGACVDNADCRRRGRELAPSFDMTPIGPTDSADECVAGESCFEYLI